MVRSLATALLALQGVIASAENRVLAVATAAFGYETARIKDGARVSQTYVIMEGQFLRGFTRDPSLDRFPFKRLAGKLAEDLKEQDYFPAPNIRDADLLLVIHWGVTSPRAHENIIQDYEMSHTITVQNNEPVKEWNEELALFTDPNREHSIQLGWDILSQETNMLLNEFSLRNTANTLGIADQLQREDRRPVVTEYSRTLRSMLEEERYFVVVAAYDAQRLYKEKRLHRLWTAKLSIRSPGVNFATAVERMSRVGSEYFGTHQLEIQMQPATPREAEVKVGDVIVVESDVK